MKTDARKPGGGSPANSEIRKHRPISSKGHCTRFAPLRRKNERTTAHATNALLSMWSMWRHQPLRTALYAHPERIVANVAPWVSCDHGGV